MREHALARTRIVAELVESGLVVARFVTSNVITELGDALMCGRFLASPGALFTHMAIGTGSGGSALSTTLVAEVARVAFDSLTQGSGANDNLLSVVATFAAGTGTGTISETGLLTASSGGTLFNYATLVPSIPKGAGQGLVLTHEIRFGLS